jgi:hypothetical protein
MGRAHVRRHTKLEFQNTQDELMNCNRSDLLGQNNANQSLSLSVVSLKSLTALQTIVKRSDKEIQVIGQRISKSAIAGSFDVSRKFMEGRVHPEDIEKGRANNLRVLRTF